MKTHTYTIDTPQSEPRWVAWRSDRARAAADQSRNAREMHALIARPKIKPRR